jgi:hypothetical protein
MKLELDKVKFKIDKEFVIEKKTPIYAPNEFEEFCKSAGAEKIFSHIQEAITSGRHSKDRNTLNKKRTVSLIYKMCYCPSQLCNILQVDHALYLNSNNANQESFDTEYQLGYTCCRKPTNNVLNELTTNRKREHPIRLTCELRRDLEWWHQFLSTWH